MTKHLLRHTTLLSIVVASFMLVACGSNNAARTSPVATEEATQQSAAIPQSLVSADTVAAAEETPCAPTAGCVVEATSANAFAVLTDSVASNPEQGASPAESVGSASAASVAPASPPSQLLDPAARIPREIGRVALVSGSRRLSDFRLDADGITAYLTDYDEGAAGKYHLHVVDTANMKEAATFDVSGDRITYDPATSKLYLAPDSVFSSGDGKPQITVFDTASRQIVSQLPGSRVAVDPQHNRLYVGDVVGYWESDVPGVRLYDASTLELAKQGELAGEPVYNPARDELIIINYSAFTADPETLAQRDDLFPEISGQPLRCNGCRIIDGATYFAGENVLLFAESILSPGKGPGIYPPARAYDAVTMEPTSEPYGLSATCSSQPALRRIEDGRILVHDFSIPRYMVYNNLTLKDKTGTTLAVRDGLRGPFENAAAHAAYIQNSELATWVLDRDTLDMVGVIPSLCFFAHDSAGRLYATDAGRNELVVLEQSGGSSVARPPTPTQIPAGSILEVLVSPSWVTDRTLFLRVSQPGGSGQALLRSTDGGQTWMRLDGLPAGEGMSLVAALSPAFGSDATLYAGGAHGESDGLGVWRSTDRGDTWQPAWHGLEDLRIDKLFLSPRYTLDDTLLAYARYTHIRPWESGVSIQKSINGGLDWTRVITAEYAELLPSPSVYLPVTQTVSLPVRKVGFAEPIEVLLDGTTWVTTTDGIGAREIGVGILAAPGSEPQRDIFAVTGTGVYRTRDGGKTWAAWSDPRLDGMTMDNEISAAALSPLDADASFLLLLGTADGNLWQLDPAAMTWEEVAESTSVSSGPVITETTSISPGAQLEAAAPVPLPTAVTPLTGTAPSAQTAAPLAGEPPAGLFVPGGIVGDRWANDPALQQALGYAITKQAQSVPAAYQPFEHGAMIWRGDTHQILVVYQDNTWDVYTDTFKEGELERDPNLYTPGELLQPVRGFGKVWRSDPVLREKIGWATLLEKGETALIHPFEHGLVVWAGSRVIALIDGPDGRTWR